MTDAPGYDAGLLNNFGGGNIEWWQDYIRAEIGQANDHWRTILVANLQREAATTVRHDAQLDQATRTDLRAAALALPEVRALVEALRHCLGTLTTGMDGVWDHTVRASDLARAALRGIEEDKP